MSEQNLNDYGLGVADAKRGVNLISEYYKEYPVNWSKLHYYQLGHSIERAKTLLELSIATSATWVDATSTGNYRDIHICKLGCSQAHVIKVDNKTEFTLVQSELNIPIKKQ